MNHAEESGQHHPAVPENPEKKPDSSSRLKEITQILLENKVFAASPRRKLRIVIEELGPTYIKLGQIMSLHSDILPKEYCTELMKLNSEVTPMPFSDVISVIETSYGDRWSEIFESIDPVSLGSASIAQVHRARLKTGENVIIKLQRKGIYDTMSRDIRLLHRSVRLLPSIGGLKNVVDLSQVLDELWSVAQEEMNFLKEADDMEEFARCNSDVAFVGVPTLYRRYTTSQVLVMEYIDGFSITDTEALQKNGYDLHEIGAKLVDNYIKQVINDGFFHADPHPGNLRIRDGKIIWIDMGMMGRLNERERGLLTEAVKGIADHDVSRVENAVLSLADFRKGKPDREQLYQDLRDILQRYGDTDIAGIDIADFFMDVMDAMKKNRITMPHGLTMLARGLTHMEGDLAEISPDINMAEIASQRIQASYLKSFDWKKALQLQRAGPFLRRQRLRKASLADEPHHERISERTEPCQPGAENLEKSCLASAEARPEHRHRHVGGRTTDLIQHSLSHGYASEDTWNAASRFSRIFRCGRHRTLSRDPALRDKAKITLNNVKMPGHKILQTSRQSQRNTG